MKKYFLLLWLMVAFLQVIAQDGMPDPTFGNEGFVSTGKDFTRQAFSDEGKLVSAIIDQLALLSKENTLSIGLVGSKHIPATSSFIASEATHEKLKAVTHPPTGTKVRCSDCGLSGEELVYDGLSWVRVAARLGKNYYVSGNNGDDNYNGLTPLTPWKTLDHVRNASFAPGDSILFERGSYFFGTIEIKSQGTANNPIIYSTYGNGQKPVFIGGIEQRQQSDWTQYRDATNQIVPNVWQNNNPIFSKDVGNIIFNDNEEFGVKKMSADGPSLLKNQGDFWYDFDNRRVLLYSVQNPAIYYTRNIRCVLGINAIEYKSGDVNYYTVFDNLEFRYYGRCVVETQGSHCSYRNLNIAYIGGADERGNSDPKSDPTQRYLLRFGNGLQMWQGVHDVTITGCNIDNVYDAGISPQSVPPPNEDPPYQIHNLFIRNNIISNCEWSFEFWVIGQNPTVHDVYFEHNTCVRAGESWGHNQRWGLWSKKSIPDPNGAQVRLNTFKCPTSNVYIRNNIFYGATHRLFWMETEADVINNPSFIIDYNCYFKTGTEFFGTFCDLGCPKNFKNINTLAEWQAETTKDLHSIYADPLFACAYDYHLQASSPAIRKAIDVGFGKDIGAFPFTENKNIKPGKLFLKTAFDTDGKLTGILTECRLNKIYRYNTNGTLDTSFGNGGVVVIDSAEVQNKIIPLPGFKNINGLYDLAIDNKGRVIVAEIFRKWINVVDYAESYRLTRIDSNGNVDPSFGVNGKADDIYSHQASNPVILNFQFGQLAIQDDNKPVLTYGYWDRHVLTNFTGMVRLNEDGTLDLPFNTNSNVSSISMGNLPLNLVVQHNGRIVVQLSNSTLLGVSATGAVDFTFGGHGTGISSAFGAGPIAVLADDAILVVRNSFKSMLKTTPDGIFSLFGTVDLPFTVNKIVAGNVDLFYLGGALNDDFALARYVNGQKDPTLGNNGVVTSDFGGTEDIENMALAGSNMYVYGSGIYTSYFVGTCITPTFLNNGSIVLDASCGRSDGSISLIPTSGTPPYRYSIDGGATYPVAGPSSGYTFQQLAAGTYYLRLRDANGCESAIVERTVRTLYGGPTFLNNNQIVLDASCKGNDGKIFIIPMSGKPPFQYSLNDGLTYTYGPAGGYTFTGLRAGTYQLRLKDARGCESKTVVKDVRPNAFGSCLTVWPFQRSAEPKETTVETRSFPNPTNGPFDIQLPNASGNLRAVLLDSKGTVVQQKAMIVSEGNRLHFDLSGKAKGLYLVKVITIKDVQVIKVNVQ